MIYYEIKKVFSKISNKIAVVVLAIILCIITSNAISRVEYINEKGEIETGITAIQKLKEEKKKWKGELTEEQIKKVIAEEKRINQTEEYNSKDIQKNDIAFGWKQGYSDIRYVINSGIAGFEDYNENEINSLSDEKTHNFYANRVNQLKEWLELNDNEGYSEKEKDYLIEKYQELETPIYYDYCEGWKSLNQYSLTLVMVVALIIGFIVTGIFSSEKQLKTDSIFFASYYGRNKAIKSKLKAGCIIVTSIYWIVMILFTIVTLGVLGTDGSNCPIQIDFWKSMYNITFANGYVIALISGYIGCLFVGILVMFVSAMTKSGIISAIIPFTFVARPIFIRSSAVPIFNKMISLLPDWLLQMQYVFKSKFTVYNIFSKLVNQATMLIILYSILAIVIYSITYKVYKKTEVK